MALPSIIVAIITNSSNFDGFKNRAACCIHIIHAAR
jgi:hypothetical protein